MVLLGAVGLLAAAVAITAIRGDTAPPTRVAAGGDATTDAEKSTTTTSPITSTTAESVTTSTTSAGPTTTTTARPRPATTTTLPPVPTTRRTLVSDRSGAWRLDALDTGARRCVEVVAGAYSSGALLCDAPATSTRPVGDVVALDVGQHRMMVAVADPTLTGFTGYPRIGGIITNDTGQVVADPSRPGMAYLVGFAAMFSHPAVDVILFSAPHTVGRVLLPEPAGAIPAADDDLTTAAPYGRWPGYRKAENTAFLFGSPADVGFYDGPGGTTCALYRRYGLHARVLGDICSGPAPARAIIDATLLIDPDSVAGTWAHPVLLLDMSVTEWRCELSSQEPCTVAPGLYADPHGGTFRVGVPQNSLLNPKGASTVTLVAIDRSGIELDRRTLTIPVPAR